MATSVQYIPYSSYTLAEFKLWGQSVGIAMTAFGWTLDSTVNGTVNWSTLTNFPGQDPTGLAVTGATVFRGAYSSAGVTYTGGQDYVTFNGATWYCVATYTSSASTATPGNDYGGGTQHWRLWCFEIWKSVVTPTMFIRFDYVGNTSVTTTAQIRIAVGTSDDTSANVGNGAGNQGMGPFNIVPSNIGGNNQSYGNTYPAYFSGDNGNRFAMLMWSDQVSGIGAGFFCIERSLSNVGAYYTTPSGAVTPYWTLIMAGYSNTWVSQAVINTTGSTWIKTAQDGFPWVLGAQSTHNQNVESGTVTDTTNDNMNLPCLPIFPLVGWVGNPLTAAMGFKSSDAPRDGEFTVQVYGTTHTYYATRNTSWSTFGGTGNNAIAMRFE